ncbi:hypothetical protein [Helicobacter sp. 11S02596-1]|uniref:hypothetical protein n=1 Tax=Helicobacter sp. 11S02596-1 TaxID=1476194 RepID=UPI0015DEA014|nr:hypothetical protein [Helicobacter sp. 11S02596-1]
MGLYHPSVWVVAGVIVWGAMKKYKLQQTSLLLPFGCVYQLLITCVPLARII